MLTSSHGGEGLMFSAAYPSDALLYRSLSRLVNARRATPSEFLIVEREPVLGKQTHPSERVTCEVDGRREQLLCKYGQNDAAHLRYSHRHGTAYEAGVYENVLQTLDVTVAGFLGRVEAAHSTWLVVEFLDGCTPVSRADVPESLIAAARWLADFHRQTAERVGAGGYDFLYRHTVAYYLGWAERTRTMAAPLAARLPWLEAATHRYLDAAVPLLMDAPTVIHGEFYPANVLYRAGVVVPIDWESAAIGAPEIDLVCLLEGWPDTDQARVVEAYAATRWSDRAPADFDARLDAARVFLQFRWLGDRDEWTVDPENRWRLEALRECAARCRAGHD